VIFFKLKIIKITIRSIKTFWKRTLIGHEVWLWNLYFIIPIKNKRKTELQEEIEKLLAVTNQGRIQSLSAKFSWLKTHEQVKKFKKDYSIVDKEYVDKLISSFEPK
jgi:hypothetical protein